jgi:hypothetical protein
MAVCNQDHLCNLATQDVTYAFSFTPVSINNQPLNPLQTRKVSWHNGDLNPSQLELTILTPLLMYLTLLPSITYRIKCIDHHIQNLINKQK